MCDIMIWIDATAKVLPHTLSKRLQKIKCVRLAGGVNENEQQELISNGQAQAFKVD